MPVAAVPKADLALKLKQSTDFRTALIGRQGEVQPKQFCCCQIFVEVGIGIAEDVWIVGSVESHGEGIMVTARGQVKQPHHVQGGFAVLVLLRHGGGTVASCKETWGVFPLVVVRTSQRHDVQSQVQAGIEQRQSVRFHWCNTVHGTGDE